MDARIAYNPLVYAISVVATVAGLLVLLVGEATGAAATLVPVGGVVVLVGVGMLTALVATLPTPPDDAEH